MGQRASDQFPRLDRGPWSIYAVEKRSSPSSTSSASVPSARRWWPTSAATSSARFRPARRLLRRARDGRARRHAHSGRVGRGRRCASNASRDRGFGDDAAECLGTILVLSVIAPALAPVRRFDHRLFAAVTAAFNRKTGARRAPRTGRRKAPSRRSVGDATPPCEPCDRSGARRRRLGVRASVSRARASGLSLVGARAALGDGQSRVHHSRPSSGSTRTGVISFAPARFPRGRSSPPSGSRSDSSSPRRDRRVRRRGLPGVSTRCVCCVRTRRPSDARPRERPARRSRRERTEATNVRGGERDPWRIDERLAEEAASARARRSGGCSKSGAIRRARG